MTSAWADLAGLVSVKVEWGILGYFAIVNSFYAMLLLCALWEMARHALETRGESTWRVLSSRVAPSISVLAPAHNEAATIIESVRGLLALFYANLEIIVVNDGSEDDTLPVLKREFNLLAISPVCQRRIATAEIRGMYRSQIHPNLIVVDKHNGGKADALNTALNVASGQLVCAIDADTIIEADALQRMVRPFLSGDSLLAAGGTIRVVNGSHVEWGRVVSVRVPQAALAGLQVVEYLRAFLFGRLGWNLLGGNLIISGAFGLFRRDAMLAIGGYAHDTVGEDMELVVRLRRHGYENGSETRVDFIPDPVAWTEVPETLEFLGRQRDRWHRGLCDVLWRHRKLCFNPRYGVLGLVNYPYFLFVECMSPLVEAIGLICIATGLLLGQFNVPFATLFFLVAYGYSLILDIGALILDQSSRCRYKGLGSLLTLIRWALLENLGYRQLTVVWRLRGFVRFLLGITDWGPMPRHGFAHSVNRTRT